MKEILEFYKEDLAAAEEIINGNIHSTIRVIPELSSYIFESGGKRFRPLLVIASAALGGYRGPKAHIAACVAEYIHTATLLHDDVVDESDTRRGRASANNIWGNEASVLVGDFLLARAFQMMVQNLDPQSLQVMAQACMHLAEGEILQLLKSFDVNTTVEDYYNIIFGKTAALISACCEVGALIAGQEGEKREALKDYGREIGYAFQIVDDCLDVAGDPEKTGKPLGNDLKEGKLTLPILLALEEATREERKKVQDALLADELTPELFGQVKEVVDKYGGVDKARDRAREHADKAVAHLDLFEDSPQRSYLISMARFIVERDM